MPKIIEAIYEFGVSKPLEPEKERKNSKDFRNFLSKQARNRFFEI
ncbi:MAG: antitoxin family protein [Archaeoglobales archaeon]|nr:antitoxin family protein [Archaeoglobales archaeon]